MSFSSESRRPLQRFVSQDQSATPTPESNVEVPKFNLVTNSVCLDDNGEKKYAVLTGLMGFDENGICRKVTTEMDGFTQMNLEMMYLIGRHIARTNTGITHDKRLHTLSRQYIDIVEKSAYASEIIAAYNNNQQQQSPT